MKEKVTAEYAIIHTKITRLLILDGPQKRGNAGHDKNEGL